MRVYLCSRYSRFPEMQGYAAELASLGHRVTSRWIRGDHELRSSGQAETDAWHVIWAQEDWDDLFSADTCIAFTEGPGDIPGRSRGGRHVEFGAALALRKRCVVIQHRENVFHWLPSVAYYATWDTYLATLRGPQ